MTQDRIEQFEERAALIEFESGEHISRQVSEKLAAEYLKLTRRNRVFAGSGIARF